MGFIAFFAVAFPFAPLFSFLTNLLEITIKLNNIAKYGRRNAAQGTSGIGNWNQIMGFISYFAIPINVIILLVCRFPSNQVGSAQDLDRLPLEEESVLTQYLIKRNPYFWSRANIILMAIFVEHLVIGLKVVIALIIPDVPFKVTEAEKRRTKVSDTVQRELMSLKLKGKHETLSDVMERMQRQAVEAT